MSKVIYEMPRERQHEIPHAVMLRLETGRNDGCHVTLSNAGSGMIHVYLFSPHGGQTNYEGVVGDTIPADELVQWLMDHSDY